MLNLYYVLQGTIYKFIFVQNFMVTCSWTLADIHAAELAKYVNAILTHYIMYVENVKSQMRKGMLEYCIMLLLDKKSYYSSDIIDELERANLIVVEGTLYPLLSRLKKEGLLDYEWQESPSGPPRKYYKLTDEGKALLAVLDENWQQLSCTVTRIRNL